MQWEKQIQRICESFNVDSRISVEERVDYMEVLSRLRVKNHSDLYDTRGLQFMTMYRSKFLNFICERALNLLQKGVLDLFNWKKEAYLKEFSNQILGKDVDTALLDIGKKITVSDVLEILVLELASADSVSGFHNPPIALKQSGGHTILFPLEEAFKICDPPT